MRKTKIRSEDNPLQWYEILIPLMMWSWLFEVWLPGVNRFRLLAFSDSVDVLCYTTGALLGCLFWRGWYGEQAPSTVQSL